MFFNSMPEIETTPPDGVALVYHVQRQVHDSAGIKVISAWKNTE